MHARGRSIDINSRTSSSTQCSRFQPPQTYGGSQLTTLRRFLRPARPAVICCMGKPIAAAPQHGPTDDYVKQPRPPKPISPTAVGDISDIKKQQLQLEEFARKLKPDGSGNQQYYIHISDLVSRETSDSAGPGASGAACGGILQWVQIVMAGGGMLGIAHVGFVRMLELAGVRFLGVGGASAGAINAVLIPAMRQRPDAPSWEATEKVMKAMKFSEFEDGPPIFKTIRAKVVPELEGAKNLYSKAWVAARHPSVMLQALPTMKQFERELGMHPGDAFRNWLHRVLTREEFANWLANNPHAKLPENLLPVGTWKQLLQRMRLKHTDEESSSSRAADADADAVSSSQMAASNTSSDVNGAGSGTASTNLVAVSNEASSSSSSSGGTMHSKQLADIKVYEWDGVHWDESTMKDKTGYLDARMQERDHFPLRLVATELTTQSMVVFPRDADLFFALQSDQASPAEFARASMSIPLFFKPFRLPYLQDSGTQQAQHDKQGSSTQPKEKVLVGRLLDAGVRSEAWQKRLGFTGIVPEQAVFCDGGMVSNFPMQLFHTEGQPLLPTIGVQLGPSMRPTAPRMSEDDGGVTTLGLISAMLDSARCNADRLFLKNNEAYKDLLAVVDTKDIDWLAFDMDDDTREELMLLGMVAAKGFMEKWIVHRGREDAGLWSTYKKKRSTLDRRNIEAHVS